MIVCMEKTESNLAANWDRIGNRNLVISRWLIAVVIFAICSIFSAGNASAVEIQKSANESCIFQISGVIESGDFEEILLAAEMYFPKLNGESTYKNVVCLNSRGGSLVEGLKIAKHFLKVGIGTTIDRDQVCVSICAIIFMSGTIKGDEAGGSNRSLHIDGILGFHRPSIESNTSSSFSTEEMSESFNLALDLAAEYVTLANNIVEFTNRNVIPSDLIQEIFSHKGNDFYYINTINQVGRWDIDLYGLEYPAKLVENHAYLVCENLSRWPVGLIKNLLPLEKNREHNPDAVSVIARKNSTVTYRIYGSNSGMVEHLCIVQFDENSILVCGHDQSTDTRIGLGSCNDKNYSEKLYVGKKYSIFHPETKLRDLAVKIQKQQPEIKVPAATRARCYVIKSTTIIDEEPCTIITENKKEFVTYFVWPSGGKTVVEGQENTVKINGVASVGRKKNGFGLCYFNSKTGNDFCYKRN
jgi:hypothetical protein